MVPVDLYPADKVARAMLGGAESGLYHLPGPDPVLNLAIEGLADVPVVSVGRERRNTDEVLHETFIFHIRKEQPALLDPFTGAVFVEPVTAEDGRNYEKAHIEKWIAQRAAGGMPLESPTLHTSMGAKLVPNATLKKLCC